VAERADASGSLALSRRPREAARNLPRSVVGSSMLGATGVLPRRPAQPAEIAQARVFERLLQTECVELQELARRIAGSEPDNSGELKQVRARIDEIDSLLRALQGRFPHAAPDGDR
jgi:hypothetical protein